MAYTGTDPNLIDLQSQITNNLNAQNSAEAAMQTQIKQVTLTLEGELNTLTAAFTALKAFVLSGGNVIFVTPPSTLTSTGTPGQLAYDTNYLYVCVSVNAWRRVAISTF